MTFKTGVETSVLSTLVTVSIWPLLINCKVIPTIARLDALAVTPVRVTSLPPSIL